MEATWRGCSLQLDASVLTLQQAGAPPCTIPLEALLGFTVVERGPVQEGPAGASTPDAELVVGWREQGGARATRLPVPREALQVQLFLARLAQLRPEADLRTLPAGEALQRLGVGQRRLSPGVLAALLLLGGVLAAGVLWALRG